MHQPPKIITRLIERFASHREGEIILGDMYEEYEARLKANGKVRADFAYILDFFTLVLHRVLRKNKHSTSSKFSTMFINYIRVAFRQFGRQKLHHTINIGGLAVGLAVSFLITLFVLQELSYDKFHAKGDRIYLIPMVWKFGTSHTPTARTTSGAGPLMQNLFPDVERYTRTESLKMAFLLEQSVVEDKEVLAADSTFLDIFSFPLLIGNPKTALTDPMSLVLTENSAVKYFGEDWRDKDVMSKTLVAQNGKVYKITGVAANPPKESHIKFGTLMSMSSQPKSETDPSWDKSSMTTYVLLKPNALPAVEIAADIPKKVAEKYNARHNDYVELDLIPLHDVYLRNDKYPGMDNVSDIRYVYVFSAIAALVLIIALINYMNLATARSMERAKEVGVRKVVGAVRRELFAQFMSESVIISFIAILLAVGFSMLSLPLFNQLSGRSLSISFIDHPEWIAGVVVIWILISMIGGAYPASVLSSFRPAKVLKGKLGKMGSGAILRKSLVVFQFCISIFLIICTLTIGSQLSYMVNTKIGFDKEQLLMVPLDSIARRNINSIKNEFSTVAGVEQLSAISTTPVNIGGMSTVVGGDVGDTQRMIANVGVGPNFVTTAGLELIAGSDLSPEVLQDGTWEFLINESALEFFNWSAEDAVGKRMAMWQTNGVVKGVVKDFHFSALHSAIEPLVIHAGKTNGGFVDNLLLRVEGREYERITSELRNRWTKLVPASPFSFAFVDEHYQKLYESESQLSKIMNVFSAFAILIAGLGLFGLASYTIMQRTKELGIRKVLGASLSGLLMVVSGSFVKLILIAFVLAAPLSWYVMSSWLQNFAYPVGFSWLMVGGAGVIAVTVALSTVLYHALEAVRTNPVNSLRTE